MALLGLMLAACAQVSAPPPRPSSPPEPPPPRAQPSPPAERAPLGQAPDTPLSGQFGGSGVGADGMVRVGLLVPLSGPAAGAGEALLNAAQMAAFDMGNDRLVLQPYDTGGTPAGAAQAAERALRQGARILLGPLYGNSARAVGPVAAGAGVNVVAFTTDPGVAGGNVFVMGFLVREQVDRMVQFALGEGRTRFGALTPSETYGQVATQALRRQVAARGGQMTAVQTYAPDNPDLRGPARALAGADAILIPDTGDGLRAAVNGLAYVDIDSRTARYLGTMLWNDPGLWRESALAGGVFPAPPRGSVQAFERKYADAFGTAPPDIAVLGYDAAALAAVLARMGGGPRFDRATLTSASGFGGAAGIFRFRSDGTVERGLAVMEIQSGGTVREVAPAPLSFGSAGF
ncbi:penicillin-binding protein activator [Roseospira goensis]|uniref:ABC-type branched-subunit amino acid transport system substrate-binding protein n=1 Tax=Roseospira goensis TaxID=391922 RepID=A0A7W6S1Y1_9PROT|nr:ABC-type branched-subunit amino acid transport system substrate-binding protein [Roseospira goensis]